MFSTGHSNPVGIAACAGVGVAVRNVVSSSKGSSRDRGFRPANPGASLLRPPPIIHPLIMPRAAMALTSKRGGKVGQLPCFFPVIGHFVALADLISG